MTRRSHKTFRHLALLAIVTAAAVSGCAQSGPVATYAAPLTSMELPARKPIPIVPLKPLWVRPTEPAEEAPPFAIHPRSEWASDGPKANRMELMGRVTRITVHHEGMDPAESCTTSEVKAELRTIQKGHESRMNAGDIGYHYVIDYNGRIWAGRSLKWQGAHAGNGDANRSNIGICLMGNFDIQRPTSAQMGSLRNLLDYLMGKYSVSSSRVYTHREIKRVYGLSGTECPGKYLQSQMSALRSRLADSGK